MGTDVLRKKLGFLKKWTIFSSILWGKRVVTRHRQVWDHQYEPTTLKYWYVSTSGLNIGKYRLT